MDSNFCVINLDIAQIADFQILKLLRKFAMEHPSGNCSQDPEWVHIFQKTYGTKCGLIQIEEDGKTQGYSQWGLVTGLLGKELVCLPFLDCGGPLGSNQAIENLLVDALHQLAKTKQVALELRLQNSLAGLPAPKNEKVGMSLTLPAEGEDFYWKSLDAKVRNQVRKAEKSGVTVKWGREELLDDFYTVFCVNMRDLGSPVHSKKLFMEVLKAFDANTDNNEEMTMVKAEIGCAYKDGKCIGGLFRIRWGQQLAIPWASTLREYRNYCPNNALYWESIQSAFNQKLKLVDFGRSSKGEGTWQFKKQWMAQEMPLVWYSFDKQGKLKEAAEHLKSGKTEMVAKMWTKLPLIIANGLGPWLRKQVKA